VRKLLQPVTSWVIFWWQGARNVTFLRGQPGIYALGAAAAKCRHDEKRLNFFLNLFDKVSLSFSLPASHILQEGTKYIDTQFGCSRQFSKRYWPNGCHWPLFTSQVASQRVLSAGPAEAGHGLTYELHFGRVGFLYAALFINRFIGEETVPWCTLVSLKTTTPCPLCHSNSHSLPLRIC
jgi:hypothetical protein